MKKIIKKIFKILRTNHSIIPGLISVLLITVLISITACSVINGSVFKKVEVFKNIEDNLDRWKFPTEDIKVQNIDIVDERINEFFLNLELKTDDFLSLSDEEKQSLVDTAYTALDDFFKQTVKKPNDPYFSSEYGNSDNVVFVFLRIEGEKLGYSLVKTGNFAESVYIAALNALKNSDTGKEISADTTGKIKVNIFVLGDEKVLDDGYEKGIHSLGIKYGDSYIINCSSVAAEGNYRLEKLMDRLFIDAGLGGEHSDGPEADVTGGSNSEDNDSEETSSETGNSESGGSGASFYYYPTIHFGKTDYSDEVITFYRCSDIKIEPEINVDRIYESLLLAEKWLISNFNSNGYFNYLYFSANGTYSEENNMIRQLMASRVIAEESSSHKEHLKIHEFNLNHIFKEWYREKFDDGYIYFDNKSKLGANAMALRTLVYSPYFSDYQMEAFRLANSILSLQGPDGALKAWYVAPGYEYDEEHLLRFYAGEAILSLVELYQKTGEERYLDAAILSQDYYMKKYLDDLDDNYLPAFVPWHTMSLYKLYMITKDEKYRDAIFTFNDKLIQMQNQDGKPYVDYLGRFYDPDYPEYGVPHAASTAIYVEGLCYAYEIAALEKDMDRLYEYKKAIFLGAHNLMNLQFSGADMYYLHHPERVEGAIKTSEDTNSIRVDNTQHTIDAFTRIVTIFDK